MSIYDLQEKLDLRKWLDSEKNKKDMCGEYVYCAFCDLKATTPCATAFNKMKEQDCVKKVDLNTMTTCLGKKFNLDKVMSKKANRKSLTFAEKYALSDSSLKERYAVLQNALTATDKGAERIKSRISKQCDTYRCNGKTVAKITIIGTSLRLNLPLDCNSPEFNDGRTPHVDMSHKKVYEEVPFQFKVNSKLALKRALSLIEYIK